LEFGLTTRMREGGSLMAARGPDLECHLNTMFACVQAVPEDDDAVVKHPDVKSIVLKSSSGNLSFCRVARGAAVAGASLAPSARHACRRISEHDRSDDQIEPQHS
jgi:hypothetical protein